MSFDKLKTIKKIEVSKDKSSKNSIKKDIFEFEKYNFDDSSGDNRFVFYQNLKDKEGFIEISLVQEIIELEEWEIEEMNKEELRDLSKFVFMIQYTNEDEDIEIYKDEYFDLTMAFKESSFIKYFQERVFFYNSSMNIDYELKIKEEDLKSLYFEINNVFFISKKIKKTLNSTEIKKERDSNNYSQNIREKLSPYFTVKFKDSHLFINSKEIENFELEFTLNEKLKLEYKYDGHNSKYFDDDIGDKNYGYYDLIEDYDFSKFDNDFIEIDRGCFSFNLEKQEDSIFIEQLILLGKLFQEISLSFKQIMIEKEHKNEIKELNEMKNIINHGKLYNDYKNLYIQINLPERKFLVKAKDMFNEIHLYDILFNISEILGLKQIQHVFQKTKILKSHGNYAKMLLQDINGDGENYGIGSCTPNFGPILQDYLSELYIYSYSEDNGGYKYELSYGHKKFSLKKQNQYCNIDRKIIEYDDKIYFLKGRSSINHYNNQPIPSYGVLYELNKNENGDLILELSFNGVYSLTDNALNYLQGFSFFQNGYSLLSEPFSNKESLKSLFGNEIYIENSKFYDIFNENNKNLISKNDLLKFVKEKFPNAFYYSVGNSPFSYNSYKILTLLSKDNISVGTIELNRIYFIYKNEFYIEKDITSFIMDFQDSIASYLKFKSKYHGVGSDKVCKLFINPSTKDYIILNESLSLMATTEITLNYVIEAFPNNYKYFVYISLDSKGKISEIKASK